MKLNESTVILNIKNEEYVREINKLKIDHIKDIELLKEELSKNFSTFIKDTARKLRDFIVFIFKRNH